ncbi:adenylate/guanylate cyclase domain-containing protein [bacterium]|nr:adenylate/guanylate cyclase domain-containing protein [bacterium]
MELKIFKSRFKFKRRCPHFGAFWIAILATCLALVVYLTGPDFLDIMELKAYDLRFQTRGIRQPDPAIVIAAVDQKSIDRIGRWPWPRSVHARLLDGLSQAGARVIGYDVTFPVPDENSELKMVRGFLESYEALGIIQEGENAQEFYHMMVEAERGADNDLELERAISRAGNVVLGLFFFLSEKEAGDQSPESLARDKAIISPYRFSLVQHLDPVIDSACVTRAFGVEPNLERFTVAGLTCGFFNMNPDPDGVIRWETTVINFDGDYYPSLDLQVSGVYRGLGRDDIVLRMSVFGAEGIFMGEDVIPTDERGRMLINYQGPEGTYPYYSVADILDGSAPPGTFRDKIVLIGVTSVGIYDMRFTPFGVTAGVEVHAQAIDNILNRDFIIRPDWFAIFDIVIIILLGVFLGLLLPRMRHLFTIFLCLAVAGVYIILNQKIFENYGLWLNMVYPVLQTGFVFAAVTVYRFATEEKEKKKIKATFSHYLAPDIVNELVKNPDLLRLGGEKKVLTCLFSDIRDFTTISEGIKPEELVGLLNEYTTAMTDIIMKYNGLLDKYIGDAIMAVFCTPIEETDHPARACFAAIDMCKNLEGLQREWQAKGFPKIRIGVGINTGEMVAGNMGSMQRFNYTVLGDNVNLASRLEGANKEYGTQIIISQYTYEKAKGIVLARELDSVRVKGRNEPVVVYELLARTGPKDFSEGKTGHDQDGRNIKTLICLFEEALFLYKKREWKEAESAFQRVLEFCPHDGPSMVYVKRCQQLACSPPPLDWDGVFTMKEK